MKNLEEVRGRCRIEGGHWLWAGSRRPDGRANIYGPDHTHGRKSVQPGPRAVWHMVSGQPIPPGWRVFGICDEKACCNPEHVGCSPAAKGYGRLARSGVLKGNLKQILANRAINRARSKVDASLIAEIQESSETGKALAERLGVSRQVVSKARRGQYRFLGASANHFAGLAR